MNLKKALLLTAAVAVILAVILAAGCTGTTENATTPVSHVTASALDGYTATNTISDTPLENRLVTEKAVSDALAELKAYVSANGTGFNLSGITFDKADYGKVLKVDANGKLTLGRDATGSGSSTTYVDAKWGSIGGTLSKQSDLQAALDAKQKTLTAGENITIAEDGTISAAGSVSATWENVTGKPFDYLGDTLTANATALNVNTDKIVSKEALTAEVSKLTAEDKQLEVGIADLQSSTAVIKENVKDEQKAREAEDAEIKKNVDALQSATDDIKNKVEDEKKAREAEDTELKSDIGEIQSSIQELDTTVTEEKAARADADTKLEGKVANEESYRFEADNEIHETITAINESFSSDPTTEKPTFKATMRINGDTKTLKTVENIISGSIYSWTCDSDKNGNYSLTVTVHYNSNDGLHPMTMTSPVFTKFPALVVNGEEVCWPDLTSVTSGSGIVTGDMYFDVLMGVDEDWYTVIKLVDPYFSSNNDLLVVKKGDSVLKEVKPPEVLSNLLKFDGWYTDANAGTAIKIGESSGGKMVTTAHPFVDAGKWTYQGECITLYAHWTPTK